MKNKNIAAKLNYTDRLAAYVFASLLICIAATIIFKFSSDVYKRQAL